MRDGNPLLTTAFRPWWQDSFSDISSHHSPLCSLHCSQPGIFLLKYIPFFAIARPLTCGSYCQECSLPRPSQGCPFLILPSPPECNASQPFPAICVKIPSALDSLVLPFTLFSHHPVSVFQSSCYPLQFPCLFICSLKCLSPHYDTSSIRKGACTLVHTHIPPVPVSESSV